MQKNDKKNKKRGKLIKCDVCKLTLDTEKEREIGNLVEEDGITVLYCQCGNIIQVK